MYTANADTTKDLLKNCVTILFSARRRRTEKQIAGSF